MRVGLVRRLLVAASSMSMRVTRSSMSPGTLIESFAFAPPAMRGQRTAIIEACASTASPKPMGEDDDAANGKSQQQPQSSRKRTPARAKRDSGEGSPKSSGKRAKAAVALEPPDGWRETYDLIEELRADRTAVVDSMGTEAIAEDDGAPSDPDERAYHVLISLMLSSQTKDTVNLATMQKLRAHGLTVANILATPDETLNELIRAVGFHNNKVKYIKEASAILRDEHGGRVPDTMEGLLALPGVGPKMALICLNVNHGKVEGISVDTHVHRICNQLGWCGEGGTKQPEQTRRAIESWMPRDVWPHVNLLLVGLGQEVQTERPKLLGKALGCSDPERALRLLATLGVPLGRALKAAGLDAPPFVEEEGL